MPKTIAFVNAKGGAGKTTAALLFAMAMRQSALDVAIDDRDINQVASATAPRLGIKVGRDAAYVIIDTAGYLHDPQLAEVVRTADLVVIVMAPTPTDLMVSRGTADFVRSTRDPLKKTVVLFTRVQPNRFALALDSFAKELKFPVLMTVLRHRTSFIASQLDGWSALSKTEKVEVFDLAVQLVQMVVDPPEAARPTSGSSAQPMCIQADKPTSVMSAEATSRRADELTSR